MSAGPFDARLAHLEGAFEQVNERLASIEHRLEVLGPSLLSMLEHRFGQVDQRFGLLEQRFTAIDQRFNWLIGTIIGTWITTILAILLHR